MMSLSDKIRCGSNNMWEMTAKSLLLAESQKQPNSQYQFEMFLLCFELHVGKPGSHYALNV